MKALLTSAVRGQYGALSDFQYHAVFPPEFSVLPQKISENLRVGSPSDANSREMREFYKILNVKGLYTREIFLTHEKHHIGT